MSQYIPCLSLYYNIVLYNTSGDGAILLASPTRKPTIPPTNLAAVMSDVSDTRLKLKNSVPQGLASEKREIVPVCRFMQSLDE
jgi:hypothetical protein